MGKVTEQDLYGTNFSIESMKIIAESIGIGNLQDDAAKELADDISFRLKHLIQDSAKFMNHSKRVKLLPSDIDSALKVRNIEPQYGFHTTEPLPFRFASGGGRELHFVEEKEIDLSEALSNINTKLPLEVSVRTHWLAIDGTQPTIPENPAPVSKEIQKAEAVDPINKKPMKATAGKPSTGKQKLKNVETVQIKQLATHELSVEQQLYYKEITEACVGAEELPRAEALQSLVSDPGLHEMLPRMCTFIIEGIRVNVVQSNLALLIYLMRMVKALVDNQSLYLEKYLHELIPSVITCIVSKQLCARPEADNHWALRDFASRLMGQICKNFNTSTNNIQTRVTRVFSDAVNRCDKLPLSSLYGALHGLSELGTEVTRIFILPKVRSIGARIGSYCDLLRLHRTDKAANEKMAADLIASDHISQLLIRVLTPVVKNLRSPPDNLEEYRQEYGYLGKGLHEAVLKARSQPITISTLAGNSISGTNSSTSVTAPAVGQNITRNISTGGIIQQANLQNRTFVMGSQQSGQRITIQQNSQQKMILMQQNPQSNQIASNTVVKLVPSVQNASSQPKLVVVSNPGNFSHAQITTNKTNFVSHQTQSLEDMSHN